MIKNSECKIQNAEFFYYFLMLIFDFSSAEKVTNDEIRNYCSDNRIHNNFENMIVFDDLISMLTK